MYNQNNYYYNNIIVNYAYYVGGPYHTISFIRSYDRIHVIMLDLDLDLVEFYLSIGLK